MSLSYKLWFKRISNLKLPVFNILALNFNFIKLALNLIFARVFYFFRTIVPSSKQALVSTKLKKSRLYQNYHISVLGLKLGFFFGYFFFLTGLRLETSRLKENKRKLCKQSRPEKNYVYFQVLSVNVLQNYLDMDIIRIRKIFYIYHFQN